MKKTLYISIVLLISLLLLGCQNNSPKVKETESKLTVGIVQKEIKKGMSQADVASVLGSPNIVTKEDEYKEAWIYDKISSSIDYAKSSSYGTLILIGNNSSAGASTSSQKTLTIIIKFEKGKVYEYKYHASSF